MAKAHSKITPFARVDSLAGFIRAVDRVYQLWNRDPFEQFDPWFRGQANAAWPLLPSLYRDQELASYGDAHMDDFKLKAYPYLEGIAQQPADDWDWYFLMQHHGLPTRLLDWTEGALLALYFAVRDSLTTYPDAKKPPDACVWLLDPWQLNEKIARKGDRILFPTDRAARAYMSERVETPPPPIAIVAPLKSRRIAAQKGVFTLHGSAERGLDSYMRLRKGLVRIDIAWNSIDRLRRSLVRAGVTETTVFPELTGLCQELRYYWRDEY
jgi:hypothetical protein